MDREIWSSFQRERSRIFLSNFTGFARKGGRSHPELITPTNLRTEMTLTCCLPSFADVDDYVTGACLWPTPYLTYSLGMHGDGKLRCSVTADETFKAAFAVAAMAATTGSRVPAGAANSAGNIGVGSVKRGSLIGW